MKHMSKNTSKFIKIKAINKTNKRFHLKYIQTNKNVFETVSFHFNIHSNQDIAWSSGAQQR